MTIPRNQEFNMPTQFLPISNSSSSSSSNSSGSSSSSDSSDDDDDDDDDDDERNILHVLQDAQQQRLINSSPLRPVTESTGKKLFFISRHDSVVRLIKFKTTAVDFSFWDATD